MRSIRFYAPLLLLAALLSLLTGCGGGNSGGKSTARRKVTIQLLWPSATKKASRVIIARIQSALIEVYDGSTRIGVVKLTAPTAGGTLSATATLDLPLKGLTFFANAFDVPVAPDYVTDPANGQLAKGAPGATVPLAPADPVTGASADVRPVGHAVALVDISTLPVNGATPPTINFTWNNTITTLVPLPSSTTLSLDSPDVDVTTLVQARAADGAAILVAPSAFSASIDTTDALGLLRANFVSGTTTLHLSASGTVRVKISDNEVNTPAAQPEFSQPPISVAVTYTIKPRAVPVNLTLDTTSPTFLNTLPLYARSVRVRLVQTSLGSSPDGIQDTPPADAMTFLPTTFTPPATLASSGTIAVNGTLIVPFTYSGRGITLILDALSNADGTGAILATNQIPIAAGSLPTAATTEPAIALNLLVTSFQFTPPNPTITLVNPANTTLQPSLNTVQLSLNAIVSNTADPTAPSVIAIDPRTVAPLQPATAGVVSLSVQTPVGQNPYLLATGLTNGSTTLTATDHGKTGAVTFTVKYATGAGGLNIN